ncbi:histidinol-phosphate transaminase [uncultured Dubosiella sp.]|uniref:histidinol-phosphate transaminase n=1 Tax=uncultured Dubosiella sp. TaxID=1937011 RepID=UPI0025B4E65A|nr:histidinol-phosphate transaminase [uncultured Dubosiella sp.]
MSARNKAVSAYEAHVQEGVLLNANESPANFDEQILTEIKAALDTTLFHRYPDDSYRSLKEAYAQVVGVEPDMVLCGNGSDQMLGLLIGCAMAEGKTLATLAPDFGMYDYYVSMYGGTIKKYPIAAGKPLDMDAFVAFAKDADMVLFSNPNNPTGNLVSGADIEKLLQTIRHVPVVIDEAYMEFADESVVGLLDQYPNLFVTRTLSKAYGAAGIRLGFLLSRAENIQKLGALNVPYNVSRTTQTIGEILLRHAATFAKRVEQICRQRERFAELAPSLRRFTVHPSRANFVLVEGEGLDDLLAAFKARNIVVREYAGKPYCRITIGSEAENDQVLEIIRKVDESDADV